MKTSTGLALSLITLLSLRAAAQTAGDAAFASAFGKAPSAAKMAQLRATPQRPPAVKPPAAPDDVWQKVLETIKRDGKYTPEVEDLTPGTFSLEDVVSTATHTTYLITFVGTLNEEGQFEVLGAMFVFKDSKTDPASGNTSSDQWAFETDVYGQVVNAGHATVVTTPDGKPVSTIPDALKPSDPRLKAQYDSILKHWAERKP